MKSEIKISDNRLEMTRVFEAPREQVFEAWKETELLEQWWGCAQTTKVESTMDFRTGGSFTHVMHLEGAGKHPFSGTFDKIVEPELIAWHVDFNGTIAHVTVQFFEEDEQTRLVLVQEGFPQLPDIDMPEMVSQGFSAALDKLARLLNVESV